MKIINNDRAAIILSLVASTAKSQYAGKLHNVVSKVKKVPLKPGLNNVQLSEAETEELLKMTAVVSYIEEGTLRFPDDEELEGIFQTKQKAVRARLARISKAPNPDDEVKTEDNAEVSALRSQVDALTALVEAAGLGKSEAGTEGEGDKTPAKVAKKTTKKVGKKAKKVVDTSGGE